MIPSLNQKGILALHEPTFRSRRGNEADGITSTEKPPPYLGGYNACGPAACQNQMETPRDLAGRSRRIFCAAAGLILACVIAKSFPSVRAEEPDPRPNVPSVIRIAAASDLKFAMDELIANFEKQDPHSQVNVSYGSSGNFFAQLSNRAPFDMFFSADMHYPRQLSEAGLAWPESEFSYGIGRIVIWVPAQSSLDVEKTGAAALLNPAIRKIAVANPKHAPYGQAAVAALKALNVYSKVEGKLVFGENIAQAAQFVQSGSADAGILALSLARAPALNRQGRYWEIPQEAHPKLEQGGIILKWCANMPLAQSFRSFVLGESGRAILNRFGFIPAGK